MEPEKNISFECRDGLFLPRFELSLNPGEPASFAFVSHAGIDFLPLHDRILCTSGTRLLLEEKFGPIVSEFISLDFGEDFELEGCRISLHPSGSHPGAAQFMVEDSDSGKRLLYVSSFKCRPSPVVEPLEVIGADTLILETPFGLPAFVFPDEETLSELGRFVRLTLDEGEIPVIQVHSPGLAQELICGIRERLNVPFQVDASIAAANRVIGEMGFRVPSCEIFAPDDRSPQGYVVLLSPQAFTESAYTLGGSRLAVATGWALHSGTRDRFEADEFFTLSDEAGYDELLSLVERVDAPVTYTLRGFASSFASDLRNAGREAWSLEGPNQLEFDLGLRASLVRPSIDSRSSTGGGEFSKFANLCQEIAAEPGRNRKCELLAGYLKSLPDDVLEAVCLYLGGKYFPATVLIGKRRSPVRWPTIKRAILKASRVPESDFQKIAVASLADRPQLAAQLLTGKGRGESVSLIEVRAFFESLLDLPGQDAVEELLTAWFSRVHHSEAALIVAILLGDLRIGLKDALIEEAIAEAFECPPEEVRIAQMYSGHLGLTARLAKEGRLDQWELIPFNPISFMLPAPAESAEEFVERLGGEESGPFWIEDRHDGIRAQLHKVDDWVECFGRDLKPVTDEFPELVEAAKTLPEDVVLDGEIIAFAEGKRLSYFDLQTRQGLKRVENDLFFGKAIPAEFIVYDLIWINHRVLAELPLERRREKLAGLSLPSGFRLAPVYQPGSISEVEALLEESHEHRGLLGLVGKLPGSQYLPGQRGRAWVSLKRAGDTIMVVVIAAQPAHGKPARLLGELTVAVRDGSSGELKPVGRVTSGLSDGELESLAEHFRAETLRLSGNCHFVRPDVVLEVAYESIQPSQRYDSGLQLKVPTVVARHEEATIEEVDTLQLARERLAFRE